MRGCAVARWQNEVKILQALLPKYHAHVLAHPNTLLVKFYGLHRVKPLRGNNVSPSDLLQLLFCGKSSATGLDGIALHSLCPSLLCTTRQRWHVLAEG